MHTTASSCSRWLARVLVSTLIGALTFAVLPGPAGADPDKPKLRRTGEHQQEGSPRIRIITVSARNDMISGGDVLVRIDASPEVLLDRLAVELNGQDISQAFRPVARSHALLGLIEGLRLGDNTLVVRERRQGQGGRVARLRLTNYPITGPIFSGPHEEPFFCQTNFRLVTGQRLGSSLDAACSVTTRVDYVYRSTAGTFKPLTDLTTRPADLVHTTTTEGKTVPYRGGEYPNDDPPRIGAGVGLNVQTAFGSSSPSFEERFATKEEVFASFAASVTAVANTCSRGTGST